MRGKSLQQTTYSCELTQTQDIQNAKRRVYDALNVLIAANVLSKNGKLVSPAPEKLKTQSEISKAEELESLREQI